ncbi:LAFE_0G14070g1_1 [Lachancea fermentati]|uniref:LAFE_0G14070g1_1 n=1 Tax=Lachancea fermentati TaxID=4955 RepID=A0A1G4MI73_LACFM|nr:LAFE_0G14070g1_1 [Lachancea fermentati]
MNASMKQASASNSPMVGNQNQTPSPRSSTSHARSGDSGLPQLLGRRNVVVPLVMQYVLEHFFHIQDTQVGRSLRLIDLIVDQTYPESLTLRKLNDPFSNKQYQYFNTVSRNKEITRCPIFCTAVYVTFKWGGSRSKNAIQFTNFQDVLLLSEFSDSEMSSPGDGTSMVSMEPMERPSSSIWKSDKETRALDPPEELIGVVFPWLHALQDDLETRDRTNYNLHSLCELFEYLARVLIQDLAYLSCTDTLPHLQSIVMEYVPKLYQCDAFKQFKNNMQQRINSYSAQSEWSREVLSRVEDSFIEMSRRFTLHNQSLSQEIQNLRVEMGSMKQLLSELLQSQRQLVSFTMPNSTFSTGSVSNSNGMVSMDKNPLSSALFNNLVNSAEDQTQSTPSLAPINMFHSLSSSAVPDNQKRKLPLPNNSGFSPQPVESPFKRLKFDEPKSGQPSGNMTATLDSILSKPVVSPRLAIPSLTSGAASSHMSSQYSTPGSTSNLVAKKQTSAGTPNGNLSSGEALKYKLSRENKTIWDLYSEWYIGLNGKPSIKSLIDTYGWRRWKVSEDSHFFPTRRIIIDYIERECDRGIRAGRFLNTDREAIRKMVTDDLEKFRAANGLTLNSLSMYFRNLTRKNTEICIYDNFQDWSILLIDDEEKNKYCKRQHNGSS